MQRVFSSPVVDVNQESAQLRQTAFGLLMAKLFYFVFFASLGPFVSFFNVYLEGQGLTGTQIGWIGTIAPLVTLVANPFWGSISDRWQVHRPVLMLCTVLTGAATLMVLLAQNYWMLMALVLLLFFVRTPVPTLLDASVMDLVRRTGNSYGRQRMWGSVGFVLLAYGVGQWISGDDLRPIFWLHAGLIGIGCTLLAWFLPIERSPHRVDLLAGLRQMVGQPGYANFLAATVLAGMGLAGVLNFLSLHLRHLGATDGQIGMGWAFIAILEIPIMFMGIRWFARYRYDLLMRMAFIGFSILWIGFALAPSPGVLLALLPMSGVFYAIFWVSAVGYAAEVAPAGLTATSQGLVGAAQGGVGWGLGALVAGYLWDGFGGSAVFLVGAALIGVAALIFSVGRRKGAA
jgi:MFS transporter, PPP family, 3-phenylpropionic acid transporter